MFARKLRPTPWLARGVKTSTVDWKPIRARKPGSNTLGSKILVGFLVAMPIVSFGLGTWQVKRLRWKNNLIADAESKLNLPPLPLPDHIDPVVASESFNFRRVKVSGRFRHDQEMLVGPRVRDESDGYWVFTPLERDVPSPPPSNKWKIFGNSNKETKKPADKIIVCRGWIPHDKADQRTRPESLTNDTVELQCVIRSKPTKASMTLDGDPSRGLYHWVDIQDMADRTGSIPVYFQELYNEDSNVPVQFLENKGIPIGFPARAEFRNSHFQYIITWYGLSILTTGMLVLLLKQKRDASKLNYHIKQKLKHAKKFE